LVGFDGAKIMLSLVFLYASYGSKSVEVSALLCPVSKLTGYKTTLPPEAKG